MREVFGQAEPPHYDDAEVSEEPDRLGGELSKGVAGASAKLPEQLEGIIIFNFVISMSLGGTLGEGQLVPDTAVTRTSSRTTSGSFM